MRSDDAAHIAAYAKVWKTHSESAVYGADAGDVIDAARRAQRTGNHCVVMPTAAGDAQP